MQVCPSQEEGRALLSEQEGAKRQVGQRRRQKRKGLGEQRQRYGIKLADRGEREQFQLQFAAC